MRKYSNYYIVMVLTLVSCFGMMLLGLGMDIYLVFEIFGALFLILVMIWSGVPGHEKYTEAHQKKQLVDRFNKKYGKDSYSSSANNEYI